MCSWHRLWSKGWHARGIDRMVNSRCKRPEHSRFLAEHLFRLQLSLHAHAWEVTSTAESKGKWDPYTINMIRG